MLGVRQDDGSGHVNGLIDEIAVFNQALTLEQIQRMVRTVRPFPQKTERTSLTSHP